MDKRLPPKFKSYVPSNKPKPLVEDSRIPDSIKEAISKLPVEDANAFWTYLSQHNNDELIKLTVDPHVSLRKEAYGRP